MERAHRASSSAAQPASKTSKPSTNPSGGASGSAAQPATLLEQVEQLGHYPKRFEKPTTDKDRAENSLAEKISKQWPKLDDPTKAELARLQKETKEKDVEARAEMRASDILERLRAFGKWPQEPHYSQASAADVLAEARLALLRARARAAARLFRLGWRVAPAAASQGLRVARDEQRRGGEAARDEVDGAQQRRQAVPTDAATISAASSRRAARRAICRIPLWATTD